MPTYTEGESKPPTRCRMKICKEGLTIPASDAAIAKGLESAVPPADRRLGWVAGSIRPTKKITEMYRKKIPNDVRVSARGIVCRAWIVSAPAMAIICTWANAARDRRRRKEAKNE